MNRIHAVIAVASWEQRFLEGLRRDIDAHQPKKVMLLVFEEFLAMTRENRETVSRELKDRGIDLHEVIFRREPKGVWAKLREVLCSADLGDSVLLDISTMPREVIWWSLRFLDGGGCRVTYVYHRPQSYSKDWLTRDTGEPRLVYQYSGIARLGRPTGLLLLSGFDLDRALRMIQYFEPSVILLGIQVGRQFDNQIQNADPSRALAERTNLATCFDVDGFGADWGFEVMLGAVHPYLKSHNIIAASLGPKVSALSLFRLHSVYPEIALSYAPSRQFNPDYSKGIGGQIDGNIPFWSVASDSLGTAL